jgi:cytochrome c oxidase subunit IV
MSLEHDGAMKPTVEPRAYIVVFLALLALTAATVGLAYLDLGRWHSPVGLTIAAAKAALIILFFMHVLHGTKLIWVIAIGALFWLGILMTLTLMDFLTRSLLLY